MKWEYQTVRLDNWGDPIDSSWSSLGENEWEFVDRFEDPLGTSALFKRPISLVADEDYVVSNGEPSE